AERRTLDARDEDLHRPHARDPAGREAADERRRQHLLAQRLRILGRGRAQELLYLGLNLVSLAAAAAGNRATCPQHQDPSRGPHRQKCTLHLWRSSGLWTDMA